MRAWFLNLGPSTTTDREAEADIRAILRTNPSLLMGCESNGKGQLPDGGKNHTKIRDQSNPGRGNIFAYVKGVDEKFRWEWVDCSQEFPRAEAPGMHWARSILRFPYKGEQIVVAHKPPAWKGAGKARWEHDQKLRRILKPTSGYDLKRSRMLFWDCNGMKGAKKLAERTDMRVVGEKIDNSLVRRVEVIEHGYREGVGGHRFATDHAWGAYFIRFKFPSN